MAPYHLTVTSALRKLKQEDWNNFEANLDYPVRSSRMNKIRWLKRQVLIERVLIDFPVVSRA